MKKTNELSKAKKIYNEVFAVLNKYKDFIEFDLQYLNEIREKHLFQLKLKEKYGIEIFFDRINLDYIRIDEHRSIGWYGRKYNRKISWPDDGKQPKDELLFKIYFSIGAYMFGEDYPEELFKKMWFELLKYKPKYIDTVNKQLFFPIDKCKKIFCDFPKILKKYCDINEKDKMKRKKERLEKELRELKKIS